MSDSRARTAFQMLTQHELALVHFSLRMSAKIASEREEATRLADIAWAIITERVEASSVAL